MLFMVIERFKNGDAGPVGERFKAKGRMMPADVKYHVSWMEENGASCFQIMEAPNREALEPWTRNWEDLVDFEIVPVASSSDYWARRASGQFAN